MRVLLATGIEALDKALSEELSLRGVDVAGECYERSSAQRLAARTKADVAVVSPSLPGSWDFLDVLLELRLKDVRVVLLPGPEARPEARRLVSEAVPLGIYDVVFDPVTAAAVADRILRPARPSDVAAYLKGGEKGVLGLCGAGKGERKGGRRPEEAVHAGAGVCAVRSAKVLRISGHYRLRNYRDCCFWSHVRRRVGSVLVVGFCTAVALGIAWLVLSFITPYRDEKLDAGDAGEEAVVHHLERFLDDSYTVVADVYVPRAGKKPAQVDAMVVGPTGLFVLEVRNWSGVIRPMEGEYWARFKYNRCLGWGVVRDLNPVRQNAGHVLAIKEYVGEGCPWVHNLIVMVNPNSRLESPAKGAKVLRLPELAGYISGLRERIPQEAVDLVVSRLKALVEEQAGIGPP